MPALDYRAARQRVRLAEVLHLLDYVPRTRRGDQVRGPCPVHHSRTPRSRSFSADLGKHLWHCFGCGAGGNALDLWAAVTRQQLHAAVLDLFARLGREVPCLAPTHSARRITSQGELPMPGP
jgi:DNA primase